MKILRTRQPRLTAIMIAALVASPLLAETLQCEDPSFSVSGDDQDLLERTCRVAEDARRNLETCGVFLGEETIEIELRNYIEGELGPCLGLYHCDEDRIELLSPRAVSERRERVGPFAEISDVAFWESIIVHELTHAAYKTVECPFSSCLATSEYAAYAMQIRSLPESERSLIGRGMSQNTATSRDAISPLIYLFSPDRFALNAWRHFEAQPDPCALMERVMQGAEFFDSEIFEE